MIAVAGITEVVKSPRTLESELERIREQYEESIFRDWQFSESLRCALDNVERWYDVRCILIVWKDKSITILVR